MEQSILRPITEVNYLSATNVARYRFIIRTFYLAYEKINYWLYKEEIYEKMMESGYFPEYTMDLCQQDLQSLVNWNNLLAVQDSKKVKTIEDFKNRQFRYQLSQYTVEIERMTIRLEHLDVEGSALDPKMVVRFLDELSEYKQICALSDEEAHSWMDALMNDFVRLNQKYQDYIKTLNSAKAEELMKTTEFLLFKDNLIAYLRQFVKTMQDKGVLIGSILQKMEESDIEHLIQKAVNHEMSIPRIDSHVSREEIYASYKGKWESINNWFVGKDGINEVDRLNRISEEIIRKITVYAKQIVEMNSRGSNRKEQYYHLASIFKNCENLEQAHELSAYIFGVKTCLNAKRIQDKKTESIHVGDYELESSELHFDSHSRIVSNKSVRKSAPDYNMERRMQAMELETKMERQRQIVKELIKDGELDFASLPTIDPFTRKTLLSWVTKAIQTGRGKTDDDEEFILDRSNEQKECMVRCEDGNFYMPGFKLIFKERTYDKY